MSEQPKPRRFDVCCRVFLIADVDESLLEHGTGFALSVFKTAALRVLKTGKCGKDFHLDVFEAHELPAHGQPVAVEEDEESEVTPHAQG